MYWARLLKVNSLFVYLSLLVQYCLEIDFNAVYFIVDIDQIVSKVPKKKDVLDLLMPIQARWYLIGDSLEVNTGELESLMISNNSTGINLSKVINKWLEDKSNKATWKALLKEVEGPIVNNHQIGDDIRTFLKKPDVYNKYIFAGRNPLVSKYITIIYLLLVYQCKYRFNFEVFFIVLFFLHHVHDLTSPPLTDDDIKCASKSLVEKTHQG